MAVSSRFCDSGGYQAGYQAARELVAENPGMQALFCATDMLALGAQDGLRDAAAPLPAIVGFDDIRRRTGSPISSPPFSRIPPCWPTTRWIC